MGDLIKPTGNHSKLALAVFHKANAHRKVVQLLEETKQYEKLAIYKLKYGIVDEPQQQQQQQEQQQQSPNVQKIDQV